MLADLPKTFDEAKDLTWPDLEPHFEALLERDLNAETVHDWLADWSSLEKVIGEIFARARLATARYTEDKAAEAHFKSLMENMYPPMVAMNNKLQRKLVESGLTPDGFEIPLREMRADVELFREANIPLATEEQALTIEHGKILSAMTVEWDGEETTLAQLRKVAEDPDRARREAAYRLEAERWMQDRGALNDLWQKLFKLRLQKAKNAGYDQYRDFRWLERGRFDYTPEDCLTFHNAIEQVVVPVLRRLRETRREKLGVDRLREWDLQVDVAGRAPIKPWDTIDDFEARAQTIFNNVDPTLGGYYATLRQDELLDLPNRKNKRTGAFCTSLPLSERPYVFMNAVGAQTDVRTLLHEVGHAFHGFETQTLPYIHQRSYPLEFAEVASMAMELLAAPYLPEEKGGYFNAEDTARDRVKHLSKIISFWPYMAIVDAFQHWVYTSGEAALDPAACDDKWTELWNRFEPVTDFTDFEDYKATGWHRKLHIFRIPFYYIEYGVAELGAVQVWANALEDQAQAVADYRKALAMGGTGTLQELFAAAGAKFAFDADTLGRAMELLEKTINTYETA